MAAKKGPKKKSKASFVCELPSTTPAKEVVAKAKAAGISLTEGYVYNVRATSKSAKSPKTNGVAASAPRASKAVAAPTARTKRGSSVEDLLRAVAAELGLARAIEI